VVKAFHKVAVVGFHEGILQKLSELGPELTVIAGDERSCYEARRRFRAKAYCGRPDDVRMLESAGVNEAQLLVAATGDDDLNFTVCKYAKERFKILWVIAVIKNPLRKTAFRQIGVDSIVYFIPYPAIK